MSHLGGCGSPIGDHRLLKSDFVRDALAAKTHVPYPNAAARAYAHLHIRNYLPLKTLQVDFCFVKQITEYPCCAPKLK